MTVHPSLAESVGRVPAHASFLLGGGVRVPAPVLFPDALAPSSVAPDLGDVVSLGFELIHNGS